VTGVIFFSPGEVAEQTGFSLDAIRYYERIGLLNKIEHTAGGRRRFSELDVLWLQLRRCLRDTGMTIAGMLRFTELAHGGNQTIADRIELLEEHDRHITAQLDMLGRHQAQIRGKIGYYQSRQPARPPETILAR
jgi:DNA-binding transcriptional MerR regulator